MLIHLTVYGHFHVMMSALSRCNGDRLSLQSQKYLLAEKVWGPLLLCMRTFNGGGGGPVMVFDEEDIPRLLPHPHIISSFPGFSIFLFSSLDHHITSLSLTSLYMLFIFYQLHYKAPCGQGFLFVLLLYPETLTSAWHISGYSTNICWMNKHGFYGKKLFNQSVLEAFSFMD